MSPPSARSGLRSPRRAQRGSVLLTAMLIAIAVGAGLVGYLNLSRNALKLSQRTFYLNAATNLTEAGLEEAVYCFRLVNAGTAAGTAWSNWTISGANASYTLPSFDCGQNAIGIVKVYVTGYAGTAAVPTITAQATITPLDGNSPVKKTLKIALKKNGGTGAAIVTLSSLNLGSHVTVDSFNSNPSGSSSATHAVYPGTGAGAKGDVLVLGGSISLGSQGMINGNLALGSGVTAPSASKVTGTISTNQTGSYPAPTFPTSASVNVSYSITSVPSTLPRAGDSPASDGRYYYFATGSVGATTFTTGKNVTIVAASVNVAANTTLTIGATATCIIYTTGTVTTQGNSIIDNQNWAGALQIYSSSSAAIDLAQKGTLAAFIYAPNADATANGGGSSPAFVGAVIAKTIKTSANIVFHYDEALAVAGLGIGTGSGCSVTNWYDLQGTAESQTLASLTGGFLE